MPQPNGYRKALRFMRHADHFGFPIVTFVDTPGAYAGKAAEESGQGEAIAVNLREMFGFRVPIISVVIGEGGSGGALAIGCANKNLIMEHSVYYVASPEACAAILWKSRDKAGTATEALRITSAELVKFGVMDAIVPEPLGAAHADPMAAFPAVKKAIMETHAAYVGLDADAVRHHHRHPHRPHCPDRRPDRRLGVTANARAARSSARALQERPLAGDATTAPWPLRPYLPWRVTPAGQRPHGTWAVRGCVKHGGRAAARVAAASQTCRVSPAKSAWGW